ncbi:hypothetical protein ACJJTC_014896 [Scirpophaga incertulas]
MSIYEIPGIVKSAWPLAATPVNIMNAFKKAGICPFNPGVFTEEDYAPSFVTDRPLLQAASSQAESNEEPLQPSSSSIGIEMENQSRPSNIQILPQINLQPESITINSSTQSPQQYATDQDDWTECSMCKNWVHVQCINETDNINYVCPNCKSDEEFNDE